MLSLLSKQVITMDVLLVKYGPAKCNKTNLHQWNPSISIQTNLKRHTYGCTQDAIGVNPSEKRKIPTLGLPAMKPMGLIYPHFT